MFSPNAAMALSQQILNFYIGVLDKGLFQKTNFAIPLIELALYDFVNHSEQACHCSPSAHDKCFSLRLSTISCGTFSRLRNWARGHDVHRQILSQLLELLGARHKVGFAVQFNHAGHFAPP